MRRVVPPGGGVDFAADGRDGKDSEEGAEDWAARIAAAAWRPFDLAAGPLLRCRLFTGPAGERVLLFAVHHLVADFASLAVAARELAALYGQETGGPAADLPVPVPAASDFARHQAAQLAGPRGERLGDFWQRQLAGVPDLDLPIDRPRPAVQTWRGVAATAVIPAAGAAALRAVAARGEATLFAALLALWQAQLGRYAGQDDFAVGAPTANRGASEWTIGYRVNPVPLRADLAGDPTFAELLARAKGTAVAALAAAEYPFALLAERLRPARDPARPPIFQTLLTLQQERPGDPPGLAAFALGELPAVRLPWAGLELSPLATPAPRALFELALTAAELPAGGLALVLTANAELFTAAGAERMLGHFRTLLAGAVAAPASPLSALPLLTAAERWQLLAEWNEAGLAAPATQTVPALIAAQAARTPDAPAVVSAGGAGGVLSYGELDARANRLARRLRQRGVEVGSVVAVAVDRSPEMVVALLAVAKAGGAYLPLDPAHPAERLAFLLADSGATVLLTQPGWRPEMALDLPHAFGAALANGFLAIVLFAMLDKTKQRS